ncbi:MAG: sugar ABC transporter permease YjfF [Spirochaetales bacterium]|uniref:Sugar ABC transporter permease YjfF n=1 Tax=Candidatus Thalassospirochaeta sargassi TaxID=3119039 RepID=A0AAJ1IEB7_9SPIO|nr:sugar ABC transporter permease YjfF [Spirochaetales bacterium]
MKLLEKLGISRRSMPLIATFVVFIALYVYGGISYRNFFSARVFFNLLTDNAVLGITAVGMTFVIISGGIDLSVGAVISTTAMAVAVMTQAGVPNGLVIPIALLYGTVLGFLMGFIIEYFKAPPFIVTLAGMFFSRGFGYVLSLSSVPIVYEFYAKASAFGLKIGNGRFTIPGIALIVVIIAAIFLSRSTKFGRNIYAIGGSEQSAVFMGLPVFRVKVLVYTLSGFCASLAGFIYTFYTLSGYGLAGIGLEMDAIASAVIGGTLMTGGYGTIFGTLIGTLIQGLIKTIISFNGQFSVYWIRLFTGGMLLLFILLQKAFVAGTAGMKKAEG